MNINNNINYLRQNLPVNCKLVAVSKTQPVEKIMEAYQSGQRIFGENKVQELVQKHAVLPGDIEWHMIGHLQSNKVKHIAPFVHLIHSVDSLRLLQEINKQGERIHRQINCLLQIFIAEEETKFGFSEAEVLQMIASSELITLENIAIKGLMGMATFTDDAKQVRGEFQKLKIFFDKLQSMDLPVNVHMEELSIGMSGDYQIACEEGSTLVRVGTAIFGNREIKI